MLKSISWTTYWAFTTITAVIYYATVLGKYYLIEIKQILAGNSNVFLKIISSKKIADLTNISSSHKSYDGIKNHDKEIAGQDYNDETLSQENLLPIINQFTDEIKSTLEYAVRNNLIKQEIIFSLQNIFQKYSMVKESVFESSITNYVLIECLNYCSIHLEESELKMLWER